MNKTMSMCLLASIALPVSAQSPVFQDYQSEILHCGASTFQVRSLCEGDNAGEEYGSAGAMRESCQSSQLIVKTEKSTQYLDFPIATSSQKKVLQQRGYTLSQHLTHGQWSPLSIACGSMAGVASPFVVVTQVISPDINQDDLKTGSLNAEPIILNSKGAFIAENLRQKVIQARNKDSIQYSKVVFANALFADEE